MYNMKIMIKCLDFWFDKVLRYIHRFSAIKWQDSCWTRFRAAAGRPLHRQLEVFNGLSLLRHRHWEVQRHSNLPAILGPTRGDLMVWRKTNPNRPATSFGSNNVPVLKFCQYNIFGLLYHVIKLHTISAKISATHFKLLLYYIWQRITDEGSLINSIRCLNWCIHLHAEYTRKAMWLGKLVHRMINP